MSSNCWEWTGAVTGSGYGGVWYEGKMHSVHRLVYVVWNDDDPPVVRHKCDNKLCYRPDHLEGGTHQDNTKDMMSRGRHRTRPVLNAGMPTSNTPAYHRERARRVKAGTWVYHQTEATR